LEPTKRLGSDQRIRRQTTFKLLSEKGRFVRGSFFYLWACRAEDLGRAPAKPKPMVGIVVGRKTDSKAVGRNLWKRRIREIFQKHQKDLRQEALCLIKARPQVKQPSYEAMEQELVGLFKKAGIWA